MAALWKEEYRVGIDIIDRQHYELFEKIGKLLEIARNGDEESNRKECMELIDFLINYTIVHFETEQKLQLERNYVSYAQHVRIHEGFTNTVLEYKELLSNEFSAKTLKNFIGTLLAWLVNHVCICDKKIVKNIPIRGMESFADTEGFIRNVVQKLFTEMYNIPIRETKSCIYKGSVDGAVIIRTIAEGSSRHLFLYGMSDRMAGTLYNKLSGMTFSGIDSMDDIEKSALMEIGNIISTYAMGAVGESGKQGIPFRSDLYIREYNETEYNISNSVILEIMTDYGKMDILYSRLK